MKSITLDISHQALQPGTQTALRYSESLRARILSRASRFAIATVDNTWDTVKIDFKDFVPDSAIEDMKTFYKKVRASIYLKLE